MSKLHNSGLTQDALEDFYQNAPTGFYSVDVERIDIYINNTLLKWLEYDRNEVINKLHGAQLYADVPLEYFNKNFEQYKLFPFG
jgi:hypothetical protein